MKQQKDFYEKPKLTEVEFDFTHNIAAITRRQACIKSERGHVDIRLNQFGGDLDWKSYDEEVAKRDRGF